MSSTPPQTLGKYQIIREIARSNDIVYEAYDPLMNRRVALKELAMPGGSTNPQREERVKRFLREARAAGSLTHPNIMTVFEVGEENGRYFIAMEYLDGHTLRNELDTHGFLPVDRAVEIARDVLDGLVYMHQSGVIHRDIKPENIQLLSDGRVKLTDFGIARLTFEPNLTMDGQVFGTPSYMSPEQVVGREIDARSDLFSLGVVLYEMIAGQKPFPGDSVVAITYAITNKQPEAPAQAPYALWQVIERALDKSPAMRPGSAKAMLDSLDEAMRSLQSGQMGMAPTVMPNPTYPPQGNPYPMFQTPSGMPVPPPLPQGYNPYAPPSQGQTTVHGQIPVYYPPPPRRPLFKPETKAFFARLVATLSILGTLFALIVVGINAISTVLDRQRQQEQDRSIRGQLRNVDPSLPLDQQIRAREDRIQSLQSPVAVQDENKALAVLYEQQGKKELDARDLTAALASFQRASELDPENPLFYDDMGALYAQAAQTLPTADQRMESWQSAAQEWMTAHRLDAGPRKPMFGERAATALYNAAAALAPTDSMQARNLLYDARRYAPTGSEVAAAVEQLLQRLSG
ncbi:MAG: protein kinase [Fimbriimonadaceae bacterium]|nr:protein kinase [Chthonomonadaceae bacterium]MCO5297695.1 protein kinase [Fimbriimonadaceae bacterium]